MYRMLLLLFLLSSSSYAEEVNYSIQFYEKDYSGLINKVYEKDLQYNNTEQKISITIPANKFKPVSFCNKKNICEPQKEIVYNFNITPIPGGFNFSSKKIDDALIKKYNEYQKRTYFDIDKPILFKNFFKQIVLSSDELNYFYSEIFITISKK